MKDRGFIVRFEAGGTNDRSSRPQGGDFPQCCGFFRPLRRVRASPLGLSDGANRLLLAPTSHSQRRARDRSNPRSMAAMVVRSARCAASSCRTSGENAQTTSSAISRRCLQVSRAASGTATTTRAGFSRRAASTAGQRQDYDVGSIGELAQTLGEHESNHSARFGSIVMALRRSRPTPPSARSRRSRPPSWR